MEWEAVGAISEAIGVIGVIVSLIYLALQVRQSNHATQAATADQITTRFIDFMNIAAGESLFMNSFREGLPLVKSLSSEDKIKVLGMIQSLLKIIEEIHYQRLKGFIDDEAWAGWSDWFSNMKSYEVVQFFYQHKNSNYSKDFRSYWEDLVPRADNSLIALMQSLES
jgi:hypothetical protein